MPEQPSYHIITHLQKKWKRQMLFSGILLALAFTLVAIILFYKFLQLHLLWSLVIAVVAFTVILITSRSWKLTLQDVSRCLNRELPQLENSASLLLKAPASLNFLEQLQVRRVEKILNASQHPEPLKKKLKVSIIFLSVAIIISSVLLILPFNKNLSSYSNTNKSGNSPTNPLPEKVLPQVKNIRITITPPAYTGVKVREQNRFNVQVEEGAVIEWTITTNIAVKPVQLLLNDRSVITCFPDKDRMQWKAQKVIKTSGFYQVKINETLSELYMIEAIKDQPPLIKVQSPPPSTVINYGEPESANVKVNITDDYGIINAGISATISSGNGEAVKFKEQKLSFTNFSMGSKNSMLQKVINLHALGMQPGDELYFYITAADNGRNEKRSDVYIVRLQDTTDLMSIEGLASGINIKPEFFRSQRQIIIETEQLLKDKDTISVQKFNEKSNDLGIDQKMLRMRYGKFLGEETNTEIGGEHHDDRHDDANENTQDLMKEYGHLHDNAEDATFFDAQTKKQLKATLNEMWNAELRLRTLKPREALPYEYKALHLLKDLQQKSRAYVAKTGVKVTPLNNDKRLTGDLSKIIQPAISYNETNKEDVYTSARQALGILEQLRPGKQTTALVNQTLQQAFAQLSMKAAAQPSAYLQSLSALRRIVNNQYKQGDVRIAQKGLQKMMAAAPKLPYPDDANAEMNLSKKYFNNLNKSNR